MRTRCFRDGVYPATRVRFITTRISKVIVDPSRISPHISQGKPNRQQIFDEYEISAITPQKTRQQPGCGLNFSLRRVCDQLA